MPSSMSRQNQIATYPSPMQPISPESVKDPCRSQEKEETDIQLDGKELNSGGEMEGGEGESPPTPGHG